MLKKYRHRMNSIACVTKLMVTNCRGGLTCPPETRCVCTINTFIHKTYENGRGGLTCPPETRCVCTNKIVHHPIYGNQNQMAQAVGFVQNGTLGRIYKSAPTARGYFFNNPK